MENLIPVIAEKLDIEIGKRFYLKITRANGDENKEIYVLYYDGLHKIEDNNVSPVCNTEFAMLCLGLCEIEKIPFKPKYDQTFYSLDIYIDKFGGVDANVVAYSWGNNAFCLSLFQLGLVFETREEAEKKKELAIKTLCNNWFENSGELDD